MSRLVEYRGRIWPRSLFLIDDPPPGACPQCGGLGLIPEQIDEERLDVLVPCHHCRMYCKACREWVKRAGHSCVAEPRP